MDNFGSLDTGTIELPGPNWNMLGSELTANQLNFVFFSLFFSFPFSFVPVGKHTTSLWLGFGSRTTRYPWVDGYSAVVEFKNGLALTWMIRSSTEMAIERDLITH